MKSDKKEKIIREQPLTYDDYAALPEDGILKSTEVRQPDIVMIHRNRLNIITKRGIEGASDLVVEILSPSSIKRDKVSKLKSYAQYKIPEYWIVDPSNGILEQYILEPKGKRS
jgi:Uma2 family endonuclease